MSDKQTTNWYVCTKCGRPCDPDIFIDEHGVRVGLSRCCSAEMRVSSGETPFAIDWNTASGVVVHGAYYEDLWRG